MDEKYEKMFIKEEIIKESIKLPNKIKISLDKAKLIEQQWNDKNKNEINLISYINECINIENYINNNINIVNQKIKEFHNFNEINIIFSYDNKFIEDIKSLGKIFINNEKFLNDSLIIKERCNYIENLLKWINKKNVKTKLLYRKTKDGNSYDDFHRLCDNQGPTLVLIKTTKGDIIGGYTPLDWDNHSGWKYDNNTFIFSLKDNRIFRKAKKKSESIYCNKNAGAWFPYFGFYKYRGRNNLTQGQILGSSMENNKDFENHNLFFSNGGKDIDFDSEEVEVYSL